MFLDHCPVELDGRAMRRRASEPGFRHIGVGKPQLEDQNACTKVYDGLDGVGVVNIGLYSCVKRSA